MKTALLPVEAKSAMESSLAVANPLARRLGERAMAGLIH